MFKPWNAVLKAPPTNREPTPSHRLTVPNGRFRYRELGTIGNARKARQLKPPRVSAAVHEQYDDDEAPLLLKPREHDSLSRGVLQGGSLTRSKASHFKARASPGTPPLR